jgi:hypothetical protein
MLHFLLNKTQCPWKNRGGALPHLQREKYFSGGTFPLQGNYFARPGGAVPGSGNGLLYRAKSFGYFKRALPGVADHCGALHG